MVAQMLFPLRRKKKSYVLHESTYVLQLVYSRVSTGTWKETCLLPVEGGGGGRTHLWSSRGPSSWDHSCRFRCLPGTLRVQSTGPCRRPWGSHILAPPSPQSSGTLPGRTPLARSMSGPGSPLEGGPKRQCQTQQSPRGGISFSSNLPPLLELELSDKGGGSTQNRRWKQGRSLSLKTQHRKDSQTSKSNICFHSGGRLQVLPTLLL